MRHIILFDPEPVRSQLLPLTFTRPVSHLRVGIDTIRQKWEAMLPATYSTLSPEYLRVKFPYEESDPLTDIYVGGNVCPTAELVEAVMAAAPGECIAAPDGTVVARIGRDTAPSSPAVVLTEAPVMIQYPTDIFMLNGRALVDDFRRITAGRTSQPLSPTCTVIGPATQPDGTPSVFLEPGAKAEGAWLNVTAGPIYIGADAEIMEGSCLRGPVALGGHAYVNMGSKIYGPTTIGPYCKVGGELNNVVMTGYSNKAHDGFLGNAVVGEWCNLGAGCTASNLKNDYSEIRLWDYSTGRFRRTGMQFCGLIMGDHSKAGINTMFNTATVVGVGCNIYGAGFPRNYVESFSIGSAVSGFSRVPLAKFFDTARRVMVRRHVELTPADEQLYAHLYDEALSC